MDIYIAKSGKEAGPFTREQIVSMLESGMVGLTDMVRHNGLPGWIPVHQFLQGHPPSATKSGILQEIDKAYSKSSYSQQGPVPPLIQPTSPSRSWFWHIVNVFYVLGTLVVGVSTLLCFSGIYPDMLYRILDLIGVRGLMVIVIVGG